MFITYPQLRDVIVETVYPRPVTVNDAGVGNVQDEDGNDILDLDGLFILDQNG